MGTIRVAHAPFAGERSCASTAVVILFTWLLWAQDTVTNRVGDDAVIWQQLGTFAGQPDCITAKHNAIDKNRQHLVKGHRHRTDRSMRFEVENIVDGVKIRVWDTASGTRGLYETRTVLIDCHEAHRDPRKP